MFTTVDFRVVERMTIGGAEWRIGQQTGCTGMVQFLAIGQCACGEEVGEDVPFLGHLPTSLTCSICNAKTHIPSAVAEAGREAVQKDRVRAWEIRAANGGPRGLIPI